MVLFLCLRGRRGRWDLELHTGGGQEDQEDHGETIQSCGQGTWQETEVRGVITPEHRELLLAGL